MELWKKEPFQLLFFLVIPIQKAGHKILEKLHDDDDVVVFHTFGPYFFLNLAVTNLPDPLIRVHTLRFNPEAKTCANLSLVSAENG